MRIIGLASFALGVAAGGAAWADAPYTLVPPAERLTLAGVWSDAAPEVQAAMGLLLLGALAAVAIWAVSLPKVGKGDAKALAGSLGWLKIVRAGGAPLGALAASYTLTSGFIALSNVRPTPGIAVLAPGWAEAGCAVMLGLFATTVGVLAERHLEARIRRAAA
jgi:hypothetical protein